ncbi:alpha/beta hydrolase [Hyphomicrobiaceae bacterium 22]|uniref:Alpha/beta hydrolase n=2 Tax=Prosthecodimorpha staleyi TaxID=2840188 RepID=A0A947D1X2_9HYPH|nr:alpha/beta hydrolase [Prosthecodimorpha staleyi]
MDLPDLFSGFAAETIDVGEARLFCRVGGRDDAPPVVLVHGYPQTHVEWHRIAGALAQDFRIVLPDLRGYGWSSVPPDRPGHAAYSKRTMAEDIVRLMEKLGHVHFAYVGHDRGARVGYRLALDHPGRLSRLALLDIVPTAAMWSGMDARLAMKVYHWLFLAQPAPLPETLIGSRHAAYLDHTLASWTKARDLSAFDRGALAHYHAFFGVPERLHATCEDYRAGATIDRALDEETLAAGRTIGCPTLVLWGSSGIPADGGTASDVGTMEDGGTVEDGPLAAWRSFADDLRGAPIDSGHFLPEENPEATLAALVPFLKGED